GGQIMNRLISNIAAAPTILKIAAPRVPPAMKGLDLTDPSTTREIVFCETGESVMARTLTRKLLYNAKAPARSLFFDLGHDSLEMTNAYGAPAFKNDIEMLVKAIEAWRPNTPGKAYLDENAPQIQQPNVPAHSQAHREEMID